MNLRSTFTAVILLLTVLGCGADANDAATDTNTSWLKRCSSDADCGAEAQCLCDICTAPCQFSGACQELDPDAQCAPVVNCKDAPSVCAKAETGSVPDSTPDERPTGPTCAHPIEDYEVLGECNVDLDCDMFYDACGCGCDASINDASKGEPSSDDLTCTGSTATKRYLSPEPDACRPGESCAPFETHFSDECGCGCRMVSHECQIEGRRYHAPGPDRCLGATLECADGEEQFGDDCGCGCESEEMLCAEPGRSYLDWGGCSSSDPEQIPCAVNGKPFEDDCGCGCIGSSVVPAQCRQEGRRYVTVGPDSCAGADIVCEPDETGFEDECGCGCLTESNDAGPPGETPLSEECDIEGTRYITVGPDSCAGANVVCEPNETGFENDCGCGCTRVREDCDIPGRRYLAHQTPELSRCGETDLDAWCGTDAVPFEDQCGCGCQPAEEARCSAELDGYRTALDGAQSCDVDEDCGVVYNGLCGVRDAPDLDTCALALNPAVDTAELDAAETAVAECLGYYADCDCGLPEQAQCIGGRCSLP